MEFLRSGGKSKASQEVELCVLFWAGVKIVQQTESNEEYFESHVALKRTNGKNGKKFML